MSKPRCYNRKPFVTGYKAQDGYYTDGQTMTPKAVWIENRMSKECRQDKTTDCAGCKWEKEQNASN